MSPVPLDLFWEVELPDGSRHRWNANEAPGSRVRNWSHRTKLGDGFADGGGQLARRIDQDYPDIDLARGVSVVGADGSVAYEGQIVAMPRELSDSHSIGVTLAGWMASTKRKKFSEVYVDRDLSAWGDMSLARRAAVLVAGYTPNSPQAFSDPSASKAGHSTTWTGPWTTFKPTSEVWYDAGPGNTIATLAFSWQRSSTVTVNDADANWLWQAILSTDDTVTLAGDVGGNLRSAGPGLSSIGASTTDRRYACLRANYEAAPAGADGSLYGIDWYKLAVYGNHGLSLHTGETGEPDGVYASDVIRDIVGRWCPKLNTAGVQDTTYVIQHLAFRDRTSPFDAFLELNKFHLWHLGVWENRTLHFRPYDLSEYQWEINTDSPGVTFSPVGPTTESLFNGIVVTYTDVLTGIVNVLTPDDYAELRDTSEANPWNQVGEDNWDEIPLSTPTVQAQALQIGRAALGDRNRPKHAGTITVRGYVKNRAGIAEPAWKVRAGDVIRVAGFNEINRLVVETSWDDESKILTIAVDFPFQTLEALFDRQRSALTARGLAA